MRYTEYDALAEGICDIVGEAMAACEQCNSADLIQSEYCDQCNQRIAFRERVIALINAAEAVHLLTPDAPLNREGA